MAITQLSGVQIRPDSVGDTQADPNADFANELDLKKVVVRQSAATTTGASVNQNVTSNHSGDTPVTSAGIAEGTITDDPGNKARLVKEDEQVPRTENGEEIFGRLTESAGSWLLSFKYIEDDTGIEKSFDFDTNFTIRYEYNVRTSLFSADEFRFTEAVPHTSGVGGAVGGGGGGSGTGRASDFLTTLFDTDEPGPGGPITVNGSPFLAATFDTDAGTDQETKVFWRVPDDLDTNSSLFVQFYALYSMGSADTGTVDFLIEHQIQNGSLQGPASVTFDPVDTADTLDQSSTLLSLDPAPLNIGELVAFKFKVDRSLSTHTGPFQLSAIVVSYPTGIEPATILWAKDAQNGGGAGGGSAITGTDATLIELTETPIEGSVFVYVEHLHYEEGAGLDYTVSGTTITWLAGSGTAPDIGAGDRVVVQYQFEGA